MTTRPIIFDYQTIRSVKADAEPQTRADQQLVVSEAAPVEPALELLREWIAAMQYANQDGFGDYDDDPVYAAACDRIEDIEALIIDTPAGGAAGLAAKMFFVHAKLHSFGPIPRDPAALCRPDETTSGLHEVEIQRSAIADVVNFVPELAALCAAVIGEERS